MRAGLRLRLLLLLPVVAVVLTAILVIVLSLHSVRSHFNNSIEAQDADLIIIADMANFSGRIAMVQQRMSEALDGASSGQMNELQLYRLHRGLVDELINLREQVAALTGSALMIAANHNSARGLQHEFSQYKRFVIMATDVIAVDPAVAAGFMDQADRHFREFSSYSGIIAGRLTERARLHNQLQKTTIDRAFRQVLLGGLLALLVLLLTAYLIARRASTQLLQIADALTLLAQPDKEQIPLPAIEYLHRHSHTDIASIAGTLLHFRNAIERQRAAEQEAFRLAFYDPLTGLPNRRRLRDNLSHLLSLKHNSPSWAAIMMVDLDDFKSINDLYGHSIGDQLLQRVAARLRELLTGRVTLAYMGGDQFAVLAEALSQDSREAALMAQQLADDVNICLDAPIESGNLSLFVTASTGISLFRNNSQDIEQPLQFAEAAMYQAKSEGRGQVRFHDADIQSRLEQRAFMERELRQAAERGELLLYYQPQVDDRDCITGAEVLLRWQHPERGLIPPMNFIPLAEETGLIIPIGQWILEQACAQLARWQQQPATAGFTLAVNVSARQFSQPDFVVRVADVLHHTGVDPHRLKLELTESTVLSNIEDTIERMQQLRQLGVMFSLDDFGTGYSSLQYLQRLPLDQLKIDRSFVQTLDSQQDPAIVRAIIAMGQALKLQVIAEGVEQRPQQQLLHRLGCSHYQGYLFSPPLPLAEFSRWCQTAA